MISVTALYCYPVKSCKGIALPQATLSAQGMPYDRQWMVVNDKNKFVTQRQNSKLALITTALTEQGLQLSAPSMPAINISYTPPQGERIATDVWGEALCSHR